MIKKKKKNQKFKSEMYCHNAEKANVPLEQHSLEFHMLCEVTHLPKGADSRQSV